jgi:putative pyrroloquinoline-quinone binding quinoprotein
MHRFTRRRTTQIAAGALIAGLSAGLTTPASSQPPPTQRSEHRAAVVDNWATYHYTQNRQGFDPNIPTASGRLRTAWTVRLDGAVYGEPLVIFGKVIVVTENDTIYALGLSGKVLWKRHVGTPVPLSKLPCGNIDPLGITGTPVFVRSLHQVYFVAEMDNPIRHRLFAVNPGTGRVIWSRSLDPSGLVKNATQQRGALAISRGRVWVPYGGLAGDCGPYHGWVVGSLLSGKGPLSVYKQPSSREAGIWAPSGPAVDRNDNMYVAVGNGAATSPPYDDSDSIIKLTGNTKVSLFAPRSWADENARDLDLGSTGPILFGALNQFWAFGDGKAGDGYLLHQENLGGIGGAAASIHDCASWSGMAFRAGVIFVPCSSGLSGYRVVRGPALHKVWVNQDAGYGAAPVVGGGSVWAVADGRLLQIGRFTGRTIASIAVGTAPHFATPTLHERLVLVGTMTGVTAVSTG